MAAWTKGQLVVATATAQGLEQGLVYMVQEVHVLRTAFGGYTTLQVDLEDGRMFTVANPAQVLEPWRGEGAR